MIFTIFLCSSSASSAPRFLGPHSSLESQDSVSALASKFPSHVESMDLFIDFLEWHNEK